jgi:hypothetical protein
MPDSGMQATPAIELERSMMSYSEPKNEREWWAMHEIERLRVAVTALASRAKLAEEELEKLRPSKA